MNRRRWLQAALLGTAGAWMAARAPRVRAAAGARVVIIGGGFAGSTCALELRRRAPQLEILLIDPERPYVTCPGSGPVLIGLRRLAQLEVARDGLRRAGILCVGDEVLAIDGAARRVRLKGGAQLPYDRAVLAPGIRFLWERIAGAGPDAAWRMPHAWTGGAQIQLLAAQLQRMPPGGRVIISVPTGPMRCPPGPFERASLMAHFLSRHKPRAKLIILDGNNSFPRMTQFMQAWQEFYPGRIEWIPVTSGGAVERVDTRRMRLFAGGVAYHADVANLIPPQAPALLAPESGLAEEHGWCPVRPDSFESTRVPGVHVIGDACIADDMPKSASAAMSQARQCAAAIDALLAERTPGAGDFGSVCYARVAPALALAIPARFTIEAGRITAQRASPEVPRPFDPIRAGQDAAEADRWYAQARGEAFGERRSAQDKAM